MVATKVVYALLLATVACFSSADEIVQKPQALKVVRKNITDAKVTPMALFSEGCSSCCRYGQCQAAFQGIPGRCCSLEPVSCCPQYYNGREYFCYGRDACSVTRSAPPAPVPVPAPPPYYVPPVPTAPPVCNRDTGGSCKFFSCHQDRGPTVCSGSILTSKKCLCAPGHCAYNGVCVKAAGCETWTPGTCKVLGCKSSRGDVECKHGKCICKEGSCSAGGVCTQTCGKDTGGTCAVLGCSSWRYAECKHGKCMCKHHDCNYKGGCESGKDVEAMLALAINGSAMIARAQKMTADFNSFSAVLANELANLPDADDPVFLAFSAAVAMLVTASTCIGMRRRIRNSFSEPLLDGSA